MNISVNEGVENDGDSTQTDDFDEGKPAGGNATCNKHTEMRK